LPYATNDYSGEKGKEEIRGASPPTSWIRQCSRKKGGGAMRATRRTKFYLRPSYPRPERKGLGCVELVAQIGRKVLLEGGKGFCGREITFAAMMVWVAALPGERGEGK